MLVHPLSGCIYVDCYYVQSLSPNTQVQSGQIGQKTELLVGWMLGFVVVGVVVQHLLQIEAVN